ncbi:MAG: hypothetical protein AAFR21_01410 [Pseudomonadota bacterium]
MGLTLLILATCIVLGGIAAMTAHGPVRLPEIPRPLTKDDLKKFSPQKTLFIIGPSAGHPACRLQRRLLKPAIAALISEDVNVIEIYGDNPARRNGDPIDWLDPSLLRHAMDAEQGFFVIYVDDRGRTVMRSEAPMVTADILEKTGLRVEPLNSSAAQESIILKKLRAA